MAQPPTPIAIVGMSCRFPGGANDIDKFWTLLAEGRSAWSDVPPDRFNWKSFYHPNPDINGTLNHRGGHFLDQNMAAFDAGFFGIPPSEAHAMDPQQRMQLETTYEALENAGISLEVIRGSDTAVYVAVFSRDYDRMMFKDVNDMAKYHMVGVGEAILANRISHCFDLKGPSMTLDTGCSGSMVALHQACQCLRMGESQIAIVGGANLILSPDQMIPMSALHILNDDGRCYTFDSRGNGYGRGEGVATLVLKRLDDALSAGDNIRAVIRNTGVNQDGKTSGIAVPNQVSQEALIRTVYQSANLSTKDVGYVETHGTGTIAGDSIETNAIANTFGVDRSSPLFIGSVKPNIGHLESASAISGIIKTILVLEKGLIPPNLNLDELKPDLKVDVGNIKVPRALEAWPAIATGTRFASVNSFGYGGTNGHVILESAPSPKQNGLIRTAERHKVSLCVDTPTIANKHQNSPSLLTLTAKSETSLLHSIQNLLNWATHHDLDTIQLKRLAYTLAHKRSLLNWRRSFVIRDQDDLLATLRQANMRGRKASEGCRAVFLFTGQGAQWPTMGRELMFTNSKFNESISRSDQILRQLGASWSLREELLLDESTSRVNQSRIAQPATTALQIALVDQLASLGVKPTTVLGHSSGEIAAAYTVKALSHEMALKVSYHRGFISDLCQRKLSSKGAMLAVGLGEDDVLKYVAQTRKGLVSVACVNSPSSTTLSGDSAAINELTTILTNESIFNRRLNVEVAYHSHHMRKIVNEYRDSIEEFTCSTPDTSIRFMSSVTGSEFLGETDVSYWARNLVSKVRYSEALRNFCQSEEGHCHNKGLPEYAFLEIGPHGALAGPTRQTLATLNLRSFTSSYLPSLVRSHDAVTCILDLTGKLLDMGLPINLEATRTFGNDNQPRTLIHDLPPYPWDRQTQYWHESRLSKEHRLRNHPYHDLLGLRLVGSSIFEPVWRNILCETSLPWLNDHVVDNFTIFPGSGYLCMAIEAFRQICIDRRLNGNIAQYRLKDVSFFKTLIIPESPEKVELQLSLRSAQGWEEFRISSIGPNATWVEHCYGKITADLEIPEEDFESMREEEYRKVRQIEIFDQTRQSCSERVSHDELYQEFSSNGNVYGPTFAMIQQACIGDCQGVATIRVPNIAECMPSQFIQPHVIHPATLDCVFQVDIPLYLRHCSKGSIMPISIEEILVSAKAANQPGRQFQVVTNFTPAGPRSAVVDTIAFQTEHLKVVPIISITKAELRGLGDVNALDLCHDPARRIAYRMEWDVDVTLCKLSTSRPTQDKRQNGGSMSPEKKETLLLRTASIYIQSLLQSLSNRSIHVPEGHLQLLVEWMEVYQKSETCKSLIGTMCQEEKDRSLLQVSSVGVEGEMITRIGERFLEIITGQIDPLSVMLEDDLLYRVYADDSSMRCYSNMIDYLEHLSFKQPYMKVMEIGAGTGGATLPLLQAHTQKGGFFFKQYDYTDVSSGFFDHAQTKFQEWAGLMRMKTLDIERDPVDQGFEEASYDLIVASNVIHATSFLDNTLANVRKLLKPGGKLVLIEITRLTPPYMMTFGLLPGWWKGKHPTRISNVMCIANLLLGIDDDRKQGPLLSVMQWNDVLLRNHFTGVEMHVDDLDGLVQRSSFMVSGLKNRDCGLPDTPIKVLSKASPDMPSSHLSNNLFSALRNKGFRPLSVPWATNTVDQEALYIVLDLDDPPLLADPSPEHFKKITELVTQSAKVFWISGHETGSSSFNPEKGLIRGFACTARAENAVLKLITFDIQQSESYHCSHLIQSIVDVLETSFFSEATHREATEVDYAYRNSKVYIPRLIPDARLNSALSTTTDTPDFESELFSQDHRSLKLAVEKPGMLDSILFVDDDTASTPLQPSQIEIKVSAIGINFKDVFVALGQMKPSTRMAGECAGTVVSAGQNSSFNIGDRVCAFDATPYANRARVRCSNAHLIPHSMAFTTAASVPVVFGTAYYALINVAQLKSGQTVLIHAAAGGVGQAALKIAQRIGAEIFVTVGNTAKRQFLLEHYSIKEDHIFSSRLRTFKKGILRLTKGKGVDVILNSVSGEALQDTWSCIAPFGTFVEIGKSDIYKKSRISLEHFDRNVTFASIDLSLLSEHQPMVMQQLFRDVMAEFANGNLTPVEPVKVMSIAEAEQAFRLIQGRKHIGKIVLDAEEAAQVKVAPVKLPPLSLERQATYLVAGGLGDLGRHVAHFMASHGAGHIVLLSRRVLDDMELQSIAGTIHDLGAEVHVMTCDIVDDTKVQECIDRIKETLPPIKGVIQAAMVLEDRLLDQMTVADYQTALRPKVHGTRHLYEMLKEADLDFFVMFSSLTNIIGLKGQANYAAGNSFQDYLANSRSKSKADTQYLSLNLGMIEDSDVITLHPERVPGLLRAGCVPFKIKDFLGLLETSLSTRRQRNAANQVVVGIDRQSLSEQEDLYTLRNPMFSHLPYAADVRVQTEGATQSLKSIDRLVRDAKEMEEILDVISTGIARKIATLMAFDSAEIDLQTPVADLGMDSLIAIELKNWIGRTLQATMQTSEILDMPSISSLALIVSQRSTLVTIKDRASTEPKGDDFLLTNGHSQDAEKRTASKLPSLPLPELESTLHFYLNCVRAFCSETELLELERVIQDTLRPDSVGRRLQDRLVLRAHDPSIDGWQSELYNNHVYLKCRAPINPYQHFGGSYIADGIQLNQAELAAVIALAALEFKSRVEKGQIKSDILNEQPLCMSSLDWIFNANREPGSGIDRTIKHAEETYFVIMHQGRFFKVMPGEKRNPTDHKNLAATLQTILEMDDVEVTPVSCLTADERNSWNQIREVLQKADPRNPSVLQLIEASAFIICLDDDSPTGSTERWNHLMLSGASNRWSDKTMQFVVCRNGVSGMVAEHSLIDGGSLQQLNECIAKAISQRHHDVQSNHVTYHPESQSSAVEYSFVVTPEIEGHIKRIQQRYDGYGLTAEANHFRCTALGGNFLRKHNCTPKTGYQLIIQIASRLYFGYQPPSWETVSMRAFRKGRVDIMQVIVPEVADFCAAALDESVPTTTRRALFYDAVKAHNNNLVRVSRGRGFAGHLYALQEVVQDGEEQPSLFTNPTYAKTRPSKIMTDCTEWTNSLLQEGGWVMPDPEHVWVHYDVDDEECRVFIKAPPGRTEDFFKAVEKAAYAVKALLEGH